LRAPWPALLGVSLASFAALVLAEPLAFPAACGDLMFRAQQLGPDRIGDLLLLQPLRAVITAWWLMLTAMMAPLLAQPVRHIIDRVGRATRAPVIVMFMLGYALPWSLFGLLAGWVVLAAHVFLRTPGLEFGSGLGVAIAWHLSPWRRYALARCHGVSRLSGFGVRAWFDGAAYGVGAGLWCMAACWGWMIAALLAGSWHWLAMVAVTLGLLAERIGPIGFWRELRSRSGWTTRVRATAN
jgi:predicted metal-binding membrane protein